ncbi:MAG: DUF4058 family protein [Cyanobacteria bacterium P01_A01_bin.84]
MPSPFPGMDPYLEGYLWPDVHNSLASKIRQQLVPKLRPRYTARLEIYLAEDTYPSGEVGILYPDVEVLRMRESQKKSAPHSPSASNVESRITITAPLTLPLIQPVEVRIPVVEIRDTANNQLVTSIEILSPVNKREPGLTDYRSKRQRLYNANVHLVEIDFLRRGTKPFNHPNIPSVPYLVTVTRAGSGLVDIWPIKLEDNLPIIPLPLRQPDADVALSLSDAFNDIYDEAAYDLSIDYSQTPPPPKFSLYEKQWIKGLLKTE